MNTKYLMDQMESQGFFEITFLEDDLVKALQLLPTHGVYNTCIMMGSDETFLECHIEKKQSLCVLTPVAFFYESKGFGFQTTKDGLIVDLTHPLDQETYLKRLLKPILISILDRLNNKILSIDL